MLRMDITATDAGELIKSACAQGHGQVTVLFPPFQWSFAATISGFPVLQPCPHPALGFGS